VEGGKGGSDRREVKGELVVRGSDSRIGGGKGKYDRRSRGIREEKRMGGKGVSR
jgi:hypothetical protein